jgi:hypothetical protein
MGNIATEWDNFFDLLMGKISSDQTLHIDAECFEDLVIQLSLCGAFRHGNTGPEDEPSGQDFTCVTLVVPRRCLKVLDKEGGAPCIHLSIINDEGENRHFSIDCFFGSVKQNPDGSWAEVIEDPLGWAGSSPLVVTCPISLDLIEDRKWECSLRVTLSPHALQYAKVLGPDMSIFQVSSKDTMHVFTSERPPGVPEATVLKDLTDDHSTLNSEQDESIVIGASINKLQAKWTIKKDSPEAIALGNAAFVTLHDITP